MSSEKNNLQKSIQDIIDEAEDYEEIEGDFISVKVSNYKPGQTIADYFKQQVDAGKYENIKGDFISVKLDK